VLVFLVSSGLADVGSREDAWPAISIEVPTSHGEAASASAATTLGTDRIGWMGNVAPMRRQGSGMAYDSHADRVVLFGGYNEAGSFSDDTWTYDFNTNTWANMEPAAGPLARRLPAMAYDSDSDRVILFGGYGWGGNYDDTWAYDFNTNNWPNLNPVSKLPTRLYHAMAYDSQSDRVILVGGYTQSGQPDYDIWAYDFNANTWTSMDPLDKPRARVYHSMAYDFQSDRVI